MPSSNQSRHAATIFFYIIGILIIVVLIARLPLSDLLEVVRTIGYEALWLVVFPMIWIVPYSMTLRVLLDNRISFSQALYTQVSGDAFNSITPLVGMGGEPYKAKYLSRFVSINDSSRAIVQSRLLHALSGVIYTGMISSACLYFFSLNSMPGLRFGLWCLLISMIIATILLVWLTMSQVPSNFSGFILSKFRIIEEVTHENLSWNKLIMGTFYRLSGRCGKFLELYLIFIILDITPNLTDAVLVEGLIMASVSIFFFIPNGLGVNEAGIVTALNIIGYSTALGVVFGLVRRARMIVYALIGVAIYILGKIYYAKKPTRALR
jgi:hypothetical protein